jgi:hypothetical protein
MKLDYSTILCINEFFTTFNIQTTEYIFKNNLKNIQEYINNIDFKTKNKQTHLFTKVNKYLSDTYNKLVIYKQLQDNEYLTNDDETCYLFIETIPITSDDESRILAEGKPITHRFLIYASKGINRKYIIRKIACIENNYIYFIQKKSISTTKINPDFFTDKNYEIISTVNPIPTDEISDSNSSLSIEYKIDMVGNIHTMQNYIVGLINGLYGWCFHKKKKFVLLGDTDYKKYLYFTQNIHNFDLTSFEQYLTQDESSNSYLDKYLIPKKTQLSLILWEITKKAIDFFNNYKLFRSKEDERYIPDIPDDNFIYYYHKDNHILKNDKSIADTYIDWVEGSIFKTKVDNKYYDQYSGYVYQEGVVSDENSIETVINWIDDRINSVANFFVNIGSGHSPPDPKKHPIIKVRVIYLLTAHLLENLGNNAQEYPITSIIKKPVAYVDLEDAKAVVASENEKAKEAYDLAISSDNKEAVIEAEKVLDDAIKKADEVYNRVLETHSLASDTYPTVMTLRDLAKRSKETNNFLGNLSKNNSIFIEKMKSEYDNTIKITDETDHQTAIQKFELNFIEESMKHMIPFYQMLKFTSFIDTTVTRALSSTDETKELEKEFMFLPEYYCYSYELDSLTNTKKFSFNIMTMGFITKIEEIYTEDHYNSCTTICKNLEYVEDINSAPKNIFYDYTFELRDISDYKNWKPYQYIYKPFLFLNNLNYDDLVLTDNIYITTNGLIQISDMSDPQQDCFKSSYFGGWSIMLENNFALYGSYYSKIDKIEYIEDTAETSDTQVTISKVHDYYTLDETFFKNRENGTTAEKTNIFDLIENSEKAGIFDSLSNDEKATVYKLHHYSEEFDSLSNEEKSQIIDSLSNEEKATIIDSLSNEAKVAIIDSMTPKNKNTMINLMKPEDKLNVTAWIGTNIGLGGYDVATFVIVPKYGIWCFNYKMELVIFEYIKHDINNDPYFVKKNLYLFEQINGNSYLDGKTPHTLIAINHCLQDGNHKNEDHIQNVEKKNIIINNHYKYILYWFDSNPDHCNVIGLNDTETQEFNFYGYGEGEVSVMGIDPLNKVVSRGSIYKLELQHYHTYYIDPYVKKAKSIPFFSSNSIENTQYNNQLRSILKGNLQTMLTKYKITCDNFIRYTADEDEESNQNIPYFIGYDDSYTGEIPNNIYNITKLVNPEAHKYTYESCTKLITLFRKDVYGDNYHDAQKYSYWIWLLLISNWLFSNDSTNFYDYIKFTLNLSEKNFTDIYDANIISYTFSKTLKYNVLYWPIDPRSHNENYGAFGRRIIRFALSGFRMGLVYLEKKVKNKYMDALFYNEGEDGFLHIIEDSFNMNPEYWTKFADETAFYEFHGELTEILIKYNHEGSLIKRLLGLGSNKSSLWDKLFIEHESVEKYFQKGIANCFNRNSRVVPEETLPTIENLEAADNFEMVEITEATQIQHMEQSILSDEINNSEHIVESMATRLRRQTGNVAGELSEIMSNSTRSAGQMLERLPSSSREINRIIEVEGNRDIICNILRDERIFGEEATKLMMRGVYKKIATTVLDGVVGIWVLYSSSQAIGYIIDTGDEFRFIYNDLPCTKAINHMIDEQTANVIIGYSWAIPSIYGLIFAATLTALTYGIELVVDSTIDFSYQYTLEYINPTKIDKVIDEVIDADEGVRFMQGIDEDVTRKSMGNEILLVNYKTLEGDIEKNIFKIPGILQKVENTEESRATYLINLLIKYGFNLGSFRKSFYINELEKTPQYEISINIFYSILTHKYENSQDYDICNDIVNIIFSTQISSINDKFFITKSYKFRYIECITVDIMAAYKFYGTLNKSYCPCIAILSKVLIEDNIDVLESFESNFFKLKDTILNKDEYKQYVYEIKTGLFIKWFKSIDLLEDIDFNISKFDYSNVSYRNINLVISWYNDLVSILLLGIFTDYSGKEVINDRLIEVIKIFNNIDETFQILFVNKLLDIRSKNPEYELHLKDFYKVVGYQELFSYGFSFDLICIIENIKSTELEGLYNTILNDNTITSENKEKIKEIKEYLYIGNGYNTNYISDISIQNIYTLFNLFDTDKDNNITNQELDINTDGKINREDFNEKFNNASIHKKKILNKSDSHVIKSIVKNNNELTITFDSNQVEDGYNLVIFDDPINFSKYLLTKNTMEKKISVNNTNNIIQVLICNENDEIIGNTSYGYLLQENIYANFDESMYINEQNWKSNNVNYIESINMFIYENEFIKLTIGIDLNNNIITFSGLTRNNAVNVIKYNYLLEIDGISYFEVLNKKEYTHIYIELISPEGYTLCNMYQIINNQLITDTILTDITEIYVTDKNKYIERNYLLQQASFQHLVSKGVDLTQEIFFSEEVNVFGKKPVPIMRYTSQNTAPFNNTIEYKLGSTNIVTEAISSTQTAKKRNRNLNESDLNITHKTINIYTNTQRVKSVSKIPQNVSSRIKNNIDYITDIDEYVKKLEITKKIIEQTLLVNTQLLNSYNIDDIESGIIDVIASIEEIEKKKREGSDEVFYYEELKNLENLLRGKKEELEKEKELEKDHGFGDKFLKYISRKCSLCK